MMMNIFSVIFMVFEKEENDEPIYDEEYLPTEYNESLEVEGSLQTTTAKDMVRNVIIDNKSCENVASNYIAEELKFQMIKHPDPYKLQWLNKDNEVKVSQRSIVSFSVGNNYKENLWCEVIPIDTCQIHLGRPWQYDHHALFDSYANTYIFNKDVIKINLGPLPFNEGKKEFNSLKILVTKEPLKDT